MSPHTPRRLRPERIALAAALVALAVALTFVLVGSGRSSHLSVRSVREARARFGAAALDGATTNATGLTAEARSADAPLAGPGDAGTEEDASAGSSNAAHPPLVSVVVPTRERSAYVGDLLAALRQSTMPRFEVLLMDQTQGDATERVVRAMNDERFKYHRMTRPGANPARNLGAALASAPIVAFTDDDCAPPPEWLQRIADAFDADPQLEFAFGALVAPPHDRLAGSVPSFAPSARLQVRRNRRKVMTAAAGASMVCRKSFLRKYGAFDELLGPDQPLVRNDDTTICYKVIRSPAKWEMRPDIATVHQHGYRPWPEIWDIYRGEMFGSGVNYARYVRRGDAYAAWLFLLELRDMSARPLRALFKLRRPDGAGYLLEYVRGFVAGLRLDGRVGYVDGAEIERMERTGLLDPPDAAAA